MQVQWVRVDSAGKAMLRIELDDNDRKILGAECPMLRWSPGWIAAIPSGDRQLYPLIESLGTKGPQPDTKIAWRLSFMFAMKMLEIASVAAGETSMELPNVFAASRIEDDPAP